MIDRMHSEGKRTSMGVKLYTLDEVAQLLADTFGDYCACKYNGNDEWLPAKCKFGETDCPYPPEPLDCWRQYLLKKENT